MTSNQIQNAANIEAARHNQAIEDEAVRHNTETERIEDERNTIQQNWNDYQEAYQTRVQDWKEQYDRMYLEFQTANEEKKRELEEQMNTINQQLADADTEFKAAQSAYYEQMAENDTLRVSEASRHNEATENIQFLEWQTQDKWIEYQNYANLENIGIKREDLAYKWAAFEHQKQIDWTNIELASAKNFLAKQEFDWNKEYQTHLLMNQDLSLTLEAGRNKVQAAESKSNQFRNYAMGASNVVSATTGVIDLFKPQFMKESGVNLSKGVKYGKEIAEALLFK